MLHAKDTLLDCLPDAEFQIRLLYGPEHQGKHIFIQRFRRLFQKSMAARFYFLHFFYKRISTPDWHLTLNGLSNRTNLAPAPR